MSNWNNDKKPIPNGSHVRHYGTKRWGVVQESVPQRDRTYEYRIKRDLPLLGYEQAEIWWASYHIDRVEEVAKCLTGA